jgi:hypothetical protein
MALGGVMLATFCGILAYMVFQKKAERNLIIALILTTIIGLGSFGAGIAMPITRQVTLRNELTGANTTDHLDADLQGVTTIKVNSSNLDVYYTVSDTHREARMEYNNLIAKNPKITFTKQGDTLTIISAFTKGTMCSNVFNLCDDKPVHLYLTGPVLGKIVAGQSGFSYAASSQDMLSVEQDENSSVGITSKGRIETVSVAANGGSLSADAATIGTVNLNASRSSNTFANVDALNITARTNSCSEPVMVSANSATTVLVNGQKWTPSTNYPCLGLAIDNQIGTD